MEIITREEAKAKGLKRFFSGAPCKNGHIAERYVGNRSVCLQCQRNNMALYRVKNRARVNALSREWMARRSKRARRRAEEQHV
jgi:hypothetical protein